VVTDQKRLTRRKEKEQVHMPRRGEEKICPNWGGGARFVRTHRKRGGPCFQQRKLIDLTHVKRGAPDAGKGARLVPLREVEEGGLCKGKKVRRVWGGKKRGKSGRRETQQEGSRGRWGLKTGGKSKSFSRRSGDSPCSSRG